jgi:hypothetical protein
MQHIGWRWVCPKCKKQVRTIYYPLPVRTLFDSWFVDPVIKLKLCDADLPQAPPPAFACGVVMMCGIFLRSARCVEPGGVVFDGGDAVWVGGEEAGGVCGGEEEDAGAGDESGGAGEAEGVGAAEEWVDEFSDCA